MSLTASWARSLSPSERREFLATLSDDEAKTLLYIWPFWARPDQLMPEGDWQTWLNLAGRGWGKTRVGAETVNQVVERGQYARIALVAETAADARDVMVEGDSGILTRSPPWLRPVYEPSKRRLTWPNGAIAQTFNAIEPDQLRGPQFDFAWCDELAKWRYAQETWDNLQFGLRLGTSPRQIVTTTPRPVPLIRELARDPTVHVTRGSTFDNRSNLAAPFLEKIRRRYEGTRLGRQELNAEILDDAPGGLFSRHHLDTHRVRQHPDLRRIIVAVDPSGTGGEDSEEVGDDVGIVAAGIGFDGHGYVLQDATCNLSPEGWGTAAVRQYHLHAANAIVGERNFGGAMVRYVISSIDESVPFIEVTASRGKAVRAEPISALYEQGRVHHVGTLPQLEDEMCLMTSSGYMGRGSPNRLDALVWALSELMLDGPNIKIWEKLAS